MAVTPGRISRYVPVKRIAIGAMTEDFLARREADPGDPKSDAGKKTLVILKRVREELAHSEEFRQAFLDEVAVFATLHHPNISRVLEFGEEAGVPWLALEFVDARSVRDVAAHAAMRGGVPLKISLRVAIDAANALDHAHQRTDDQGWPLGIVHRDVCPANLLVGMDGLSRLTDFGLIKAASKLPAFSPAALAEKLHYLTPEQLCGAPVDHRGDLFSLGSILYELTTGRLPFRAPKIADLMRAIVDGRPDAPSSIEPGFPPELERLLLRMLERLPEERPQSAEALARALEETAAKIGAEADAVDVAAFMRQLFAVEDADVLLEESEPELLLEEFDSPVALLDEIREEVTPPDDATPLPFSGLPRPGAVPPPPPGAKLADAPPLPDIPSWGDEVFDAARADVLPPPLPAAKENAARAVAKSAARAAAERAAAARAAAEKAAQEKEVADRKAIDEARERAARAREHEAAASRERDDAMAAAEDAGRREQALARERDEAIRRADEATREAAGARAASDAAARELAELRVVLEDLEEDHKRALREKELLAVGTEQARAKADAAETRAEKAQAQLDAARQESMELASRDAESSRDVKTTSLRLAAARREADEAHAATEARTRELDAARTDLESAKRSVAENEAALARAREEIEAVTRAAAELAARRAEEVAKRAQDAHASREEETSALLSVAVQEVEAERAAFAAERARAEEAERKLTGAKAEAETLRREASERDAAFAAREEELRRQQKQAADERADAIAREAEILEREELAVKAAGNAKREAILAREDSERLLRERDAARRELEDSVRAREIARRQTEDAARVAQNALADTAASRRDLSSARRAIEESQARIDGERRAAEAAKADAEAARAEAAATRADLAAAREAARIAQAAASAAEAAVESVRAEAEGAARAAAVAREEAAALQSEALAAKAAAAAASGEVAALKRARAVPVTAPADDAGVAAVDNTSPGGEPVRRTETDLRAWSQVELYLLSFADALRSNVTTDPGTFIGRESLLREMDLLSRSDEPLVTLIGDEGSGRTRLARRYASARLVELSQAGGAWYADLGTARNPEGICVAVASALSIPLDSSQNATALVKSLGHALASRGRLLLVLDDVDAVHLALAGVLAKWMSVATQARFLLVARSSLRIPGERTCVLPGLDVTDGEAPRLFAERLRARKRDVDLKDPGARDAIAAICARLDGHPLAIELVASFTDRLDLAAMRAALDAAENANSPLESALALCREQLSPDERAALARISVFAGPFTVDAAREVIATDTAVSAIRTLRSRGLLRPIEPPDLPGETWLALHPAVQSWARAQLGSDAADAGERHAAVTLALSSPLAAAAERDPAALRRLTLMASDLVAVHDRAISGPRDAAALGQGVEAILALDPITAVIGTATVITWLETLLPNARAAGLDPRRVAAAELLRARLRRSQGYAAATLGALNTTLAAMREAGDGALEAKTAAELARALVASARADEAATAVDAALALARARRDDREEAALLGERAAVAELRGDAVTAAREYDAAIALCTRIGFKRLKGELLGRLGSMLQDRGEGAKARGYLERALAHHKEVKNRSFEAHTVGALAAASFEAGRRDDARSLFRRAIEIHSELGARGAEATERARLGVAEHLDGRLDDARASLVRAVWMLGDASDRRSEGLYLAHLAALEAARGRLATAVSSLELARKRLGDEKDTVGLAIAETLSGMIDLARAAADPPEAERHRAEAARKLAAAGTTREAERFARGLLSAAIGAAPGTAARAS